jgi:hypothetical protein
VSVVGVDLPVAEREPVVVRIGDAGFEYEPVGAAIERAQLDRRRRVIVLGVNTHHSLSFGRDRGLNRGQIIHATPSAVRGFTGLDVVVLPGWSERRDAARTWEATIPTMLYPRAQP